MASPGVKASVVVSVTMMLADEHHFQVTKVALVTAKATDRGVHPICRKHARGDSDREGCDLPAALRGGAGDGRRPVHCPLHPEHRRDRDRRRSAAFSQYRPIKCPTSSTTRWISTHARPWPPRRSPAGPTRSEREAVIAGNLREATALGRGGHAREVVGRRNDDCAARPWTPATHGMQRSITHGEAAAIATDARGQEGTYRRPFDSLRRLEASCPAVG